MSPALLERIRRRNTKAAGPPLPPTPRQRTSKQKIAAVKKRESRPRCTVEGCNGVALHHETCDTCHVVFLRTGETPKIKPKKKAKIASFTPEQIAQAREWARSGDYYWEIAERLNVTASQLAAAKILPSRKSGPRRTFDWEEAKRLYDAGISIAAIARYFERSEYAITRAVNPITRAKLDKKAMRNMQKIRKEQGSQVYEGRCFFCDRWCSIETLICTQCKRAYELGQDELLKEMVSK
jgi:cytochrome c5